jgi:hypothetical protein
MPSGIYERKLFTPEHLAALSKASKGVPKSPAHRAAMSKARKDVPRTSDAQIAADKAKVGVPFTPERCTAISKGLTGRTRKPFTPETRAAMSAASKGVHKSPEHNAAISAAKKGIPNLHISEAQLAGDEAKRGGLDLIWHHVAYDFGRLEALRVRITRKFHGVIHHPKGCKFGTYGYSLID